MESITHYQRLVDEAYNERVRDELVNLVGNIKAVAYKGRTKASVSFKETPFTRDVIGKLIKTYEEFPMELDEKEGKYVLTINWSDEEIQENNRKINTRLLKGLWNNKQE